MRLVPLIALVAVLFGACAPAAPPADPPAAPPPSAPAAPPEKKPAAPATTTPEKKPAPTPSTPATATSTGVRECDDLYALCKACEPKLAPEVAAGNRVSCDAERAKMTHFLTTSEAPGVPAACRASLDALRAKCP